MGLPEEKPIDEDSLNELICKYIQNLFNLQRFLGGEGKSVPTGYGPGLPQGFFRKEFFKESVIKLVPGPTNDQVAEYRHAEKREITETIQHLMSNKLVRIAQAVLIDDPILVDNDGVV